MDKVLPHRVPLLWPKRGVAAHFLEELRAEGIVSDRRTVFVGQEQSYYAQSGHISSDPIEAGTKGRG